MKWEEIAIFLPFFINSFRSKKPQKPDFSNSS